ncbi:hypothetical protein F5883DRAFT_105200 [Diaporthe sp. PMI_573]|nr:hypothetical protein F5883DRAFT_105200 [Diaporthaceae sp. PMI_573]
MATDPAVITDSDRPSELDVGAAALDLDLVRRRQDRDVWADHDTVSYCHQGTVEDGQVEVGVEAVPEADVGAVVDLKRRLDKHLVAHPPHPLFEHLVSLLLQRLEARGRVRGKVIVVVVHPRPRREPRRLQLWYERVVAVRAAPTCVSAMESVVVIVMMITRCTWVLIGCREGMGGHFWDLNQGLRCLVPSFHSQHARDHPLVLIPLWDIAELRCLLELSGVLLCGSHG